jgi:hypothetical protein
MTMHETTEFIISGQAADVIEGIATSEPIEVSDVVSRAIGRYICAQRALSGGGHLLAEKNGHVVALIPAT